MKKILVVLAHPNLENSKVNKVIFDELKKIDKVEVRDLYKLYPDFNIDVKAEQEALVSADLIIFQFPFYWYSVPPMLKKWQDDVLEYGFAYGSKGKALFGKQVLLSTTTGAPKDSYVKGNGNHTVEEFLLPLIETTRFCKMEYLGLKMVNGIYSKSVEELRDYANELKEEIEVLAK